MFGIFWMENLNGFKLKINKQRFMILCLSPATLAIYLHKLVTTLDDAGLPSHDVKRYEL
jgi:hypothetical protein